MRPQSAKQKGRKHQQKIRDDLLAAFPSLTADDVRSTSMGAGGEDILLSSEARRLVPFSFEAKCCERLNIYGAIEQAESNCGSATPCIVFRKNHMKPYAAIPWSVLLQLIAPAPAAATEDSTESVDPHTPQETDVGDTSTSTAEKSSMPDVASMAKRLRAIADEMEEQS